MNSQLPSNSVCGIHSLSLLHMLFFYHFNLFFLSVQYSSQKFSLAVMVNILLSGEYYSGRGIRSPTIKKGISPSYLLPFWLDFNSFFFSTQNSRLKGSINEKNRSIIMTGYSFKPCILEGRSSIQI